MCIRDSLLSDFDSSWIVSVFWDLFIIIIIILFLLLKNFVFYQWDINSLTFPNMWAGAFQRDSCVYIYSAGHTSLLIESRGNSFLLKNIMLLELSTDSHRIKITYRIVSFSTNKNIFGYFTSLFLRLSHIFYLSYSS